MVTPFTVPAVVRASAAGRGYDTHAVVAAAAAAAEALAAAVDPDPTRAGRFPDAFVAWPYAGGVLVARIRDAGDDAAGRPHTRRIEGGWFTNPPNDRELPRLLRPEAWPETVPDGAETVTLKPYGPLADGPVLLPLFVGDGAGWRFRTAAPPPPILLAPEVPVPPPARFRIPALFFAGLFVAAAGIAWHFRGEAEQAHAAADEAARRADAATAERDDAGRQLKEANRSLEEERKKDPNAKFTKAVAELSRRIELKINPMENELGKLKQAQETMKKSLDAVSQKFAPGSGTNPGKP